MFKMDTVWRFYTNLTCSTFIVLYFPQYVTSRTLPAYSSILELFDKFIVGWGQCL